MVLILECVIICFILLVPCVIADAGFEKIGVYGISAGAKFAITAATCCRISALLLQHLRLTIRPRHLRGQRH